MILVALGANLPGPAGAPLETCRSAVTALLESGLGGLALSAWYETDPVPPSPDAPAYVNAVARFEAADPASGLADPAALLALLLAIERRFGRVRSVADAPRTLDLDLIALGDLVRAGPDPLLPHPRAHLRRFVLEPLRDVAPLWRHPVLGLDAEAMLARLPPGGTRRLEPDAGTD